MGRKPPSFAMPKSLAFRQSPGRLILGFKGIHGGSDLFLLAGYGTQGSRLDQIPSDQHATHEQADDDQHYT